MSWSSGTGETRFQPQEMAAYNYVQARVFMYREEFEAAHTCLEMALEVWPDYEPAQDLLEHRVQAAEAKVPGRYLAAHAGNVLVKPAGAEAGFRH